MVIGSIGGFSDREVFSCFEFSLCYFTSKESKSELPPFPTVSNYDGKVWKYIPKGKALEILERFFRHDLEFLYKSSRDPYIKISYIILIIL